MSSNKILLVMDESKPARDIKVTLEPFGYDVSYIASNGEEAINKIIELMPDLILTQINLKDNTNVVDLVSKIQYLEIPVIYLTSHYDVETLKRAQETQPYSFLFYPFDPQQLKLDIELALYKKDLNKSLKQPDDFRLLMETLDDVIYVVDLKKNKLTYISSAAEKITGWTKETFYNNSDKWMEIILPEDRPKVISCISRIIEGYNDKKIEYRIQTRNGEVKWIQESYNKIFSKEGEISQIIGHATDVTLQKESESQLKESDKKYRTIFENSGLLLLTFNNDGKIILFNNEWEKVCGYSRQEVEGKKKWMEFVHPDYLEKMLEYHHQRIKDPDSVPHKYETIFFHKNGNPLVLYLTITDLPGGDQWLASAVDITEQKNTQKKLEKNVLRSRALTEYALDGIITTDVHGKILYFNKSLLKMFGYSKEELKDSQITILMPERYHSTYKNTFKKFHLTGEHRLAGRTIETIGLRKDGNEFPFEISLTKWEVENDIYFTSIIRDITERKIGEENRKKGEMALKESEEKYRALMDYSGDAIFLADINGKIIECNKKAVDILGYSQDEILKVNFVDLHPPEESKKVQEYFKRYLEGSSEVVETLVLTKDDKRIPVSITGSIIEYGDKIVLQGIFRDITQTKKAEKALRESEEKYRNLFEFSPDYTILVNSDGILTDINRVAEQVTGLSKDELIGRPFADLEIFPEEEIDLHKQKFVQTIENGKIKPYEARIIDNKGNIRWVLNQSIAIMEEDKLNYLMVIGSDITEQKKADKKFKKSAERFRAVAESAVDAIVTTDDDGNIIFFNDSLMEIFGYDRDEMEGKSLTILMPERFKNNYLNELKKYKFSGKHRLMGKTSTTTGLRSNGTEFPFEMSLAAWKSGKKTYFTSIIRDITERKKYENALLESEKRYRHLFESVPIGIVIFSLDAGQVIDVNKSMLDLTGYSLDEYKKANIKEDFVNPEDPYKIYAELQEKGQARNFKIKMRRKDGSIYHALLNSESMEMNGERVFVQTIRDITYLIKTEEQTKDHLKKLTILNKVIEMASCATDIDSLLKDVVYSTMDLLDFDIGGIYLEDKVTGFAELVFQKNFPPSILENFSRMSLDTTPYSKLYTEKKPLYLDSDRNPEINKYGFKSIAMVPLYSADETIGNLSVCSSEKSLISDLKKDILESIGMESGTVIAKMYSDEQNKEHLKKLTIINKVINTANNASNINNLLKDVLKSTINLLGFESGGIYLLEENKKYTKLEYSENLPEAFKESVKRLKINNKPYSTVYHDGKPIYDYMEIKPYMEEVSGFKSAATVPLFSAGNIIGSLNVASSIKTKITQLEKDVLESIGMQTGTVIAKMYSEEAIKDSLRAKEVLLKEIHHRVKNNLQIISSLLDLQESYVKEDPTAVNVLMESQNRVLSMAMIHEMLYQSKDLGSIDLSSYIRNLVSNLSGSYGVINVQSIIDVEEIYLNMETSIPLGLIISELVSNSLKYAFPENRQGKLTISLLKLEDQYELIIKDDGIGFPEDVDFRNNESSLGLRLVNSLVTQLDGNIELDRSEGTEFTITFKELKYKERI